MFDNMNGHEIANTINKMFLEPLNDFQPLNSINLTNTHENMHTPCNSLHVFEEDVYKVLKLTPLKQLVLITFRQRFTSNLPKYSPYLSVSF